MNANQRKFKKVIKARKKRAEKVKKGLNNHAMGNTIALMTKKGQLKGKNGKNMITGKK